VLLRVRDKEAHFLSQFFLFSSVVLISDVHLCLFLVALVLCCIC